MSAAVDNSLQVGLSTGDNKSKQSLQQDPLTTEAQELAAGESAVIRKGSQSEPTQHRVADILKDKLCMQAASEDKSAERSSSSSSKEFHYSSSRQQPPFSPPRLLSPASSKLMNGDSVSPGRDHHLRAMDSDLDTSSKVLRGILQGKEHMLHDSSNKESISKLLHQEGRYCRNGDYDLNDSEGESLPCGSPGDMAFSDSEQENLNDGNSSPNRYEDDRMMGADDEDSNSLSSTPESLEAKRARVENIISSIHTSPSKVSPDSGVHSAAEVKRPKRKQYIPQQHGGQDEPLSKVPRLEKDTLQRQLKHMQDQLSIMQQRYSQLFTVNNNNNNNNNNTDEDLRKMAMDPSTPLAGKFPDASSLVEMPRKSASLLEAMNMDPNQFMKTASKVVEDRLPKQQHSPLSGSTPADLDSLAKILKTEITNSVGTLVDNIVSKFVEKQSKKLPVSPPPVSKPVPVVASKPKEKDSTSTISAPTESERPKERHLSDFHQPSTSLHLTPVSYPSVSTSSAMKHSPRTDFPDFSSALKPPRTKVTDKFCHPLFEAQMKAFAELPRPPHLPLFPPPYFPPALHPMHPLYAKEPEQTEAIPLVVNTPKKKRTKVTDTRLSPRAARALLQESLGQHHHSPTGGDGHKHPMRPHCTTPGSSHEDMSPFHHHPPPLVPASLPTSVAIPNPSLQHSEVLAMYSHGDSHLFGESPRLLRGPSNHSPSSSPSMGHTPSDTPLSMGPRGGDRSPDSFDNMMADSYSYEGHPVTSTLTPMHLRKAKLMFFYVRYPSSSIIKIYFPDVRFNKNNTAQLVKWFSNFREFYYIQMEKYARQALAEGVKSVEELVVNSDSELFRVLNLHYNRNNQIEVPDNFRLVVQTTLREFYKSVASGKDQEQSWKKAIYKVIARLDDTLPEFFKSPNWMEQLNDA